MKEVLSFREQQSPYNGKDRESLPVLSDLEYGWDSALVRYKVLKYMQDHTAYISTAPGFYDIFTGDAIPANGTAHADGEWYWTDELIYYVRKYNLTLPEEFVEQALGEAWN